MALFYALCAAIPTAVGMFLVLQKLLGTTTSKSNVAPVPTHSHNATKHMTAIAGFANKVIPQARADSDGLRRKLAGAGLSMTPITYHGLSIIFYVVAVAILAPVLAMVNLQAELKIALVIVAAMLVLLCPSFVLAVKTNARKDRIKAALPATLNTLAISVEAGLTVQRAIRIVAQKSKGALAREFALVDQDMTIMRRTLPEALENMADRCRVDELSQFVSAVSAGTKAGSPIADILKSQSDYIFKRRSQELEEHSNKLSVKMLFPIAFLLLPAVLIAFVAPIAINMMARLSGVQ